jgi:predicted DNA binding CopG/RHH family protein
MKPIPKFKNEDEEREFWATHDTTEYFDTSNPLDVDLSNLKPSTVKITVRMPQMMVHDLKTLANKRDVPYQSLLKVFLAERIKQEFSGK